MTAREWAQKHWEVVKGYGEGKEVEYLDIDGAWELIVSPQWKRNFLYRIKPEPKLVPYGPEDGAFLVGRKIMRKEIESFGMILSCDVGGIRTISKVISFGDLLENYLDVTDTPAGVPFGKEVE